VRERPTVKFSAKWYWISDVSIYKSDFDIDFDYFHVTKFDFDFFFSILVCVVT
jgi:hypothetical protein